MQVVIHRRVAKAPSDICDESGRMFQDLPLPAVYCWGTNGLSGKSQEFLHATLARKEDRPLETAGHWLLIDQPAACCAFGATFLTRTDPAGS